MFKKTLAAVAVLGAFAGSAMAADLTVYGVVDYGLHYGHIDTDHNAQKLDNQFDMKSGMNSGSRLGFKGAEDLGNGLKVGFVLENGFSADTGALGKDNTLFDREAQAYVEGGFGRIAFGRVGKLISGNGTYGLVGKFSPFSTGWGDYLGMKWTLASGLDRINNTVVYQTPEFAGFKVYAQYSFGDSGTNKDISQDYVEGKSSTDRYYAIAATYKIGGLETMLGVDSTNWGSVSTNMKELDDSLSVNLGVNYDFDVAKVFFFGQYFDNAKAAGQKGFSKTGFGVGAKDDQYWTGGWTGGYEPSDTKQGVEGYGLALGVNVPLAGGNLKGHFGYMNAESVANSKEELNRYNVGVGYDYALSSRTTLYTAASYLKDEIKCTKPEDERDPQAYEFMFGMVHKF